VPNPQNRISNTDTYPNATESRVRLDASYLLAGAVWVVSGTRVMSELDAIAAIHKLNV
jgi:hypothetical protein